VERLSLSHSSILSFNILQDDADLIYVEGRNDAKKIGRKAIMENVREQKNYAVKTKHLILPLHYLSLQKP
jgi:hypothetical protein